MNVETFDIEGLKLITHRLFADSRGWLHESCNENVFKANGIPESFAQDNHSKSSKGTLRGLHFQTTPGQGKLIRCTQGKIWDVAVDIREGSSTFGKWQAVELCDEKKQMFWIPPGFAHGFCVLSEEAEVQYKCTNVYNGETEAGIAWDDSEVAVKWPIEEPLLSERDLGNPTLKEFIASK